MQRAELEARRTLLELLLLSEIFRHFWYSANVLVLGHVYREPDLISRKLMRQIHTFIYSVEFHLFSGVIFFFLFFSTF